MKKVITALIIFSFLLSFAGNVNIVLSKGFMIDTHGYFSPCTKDNLSKLERGCTTIIVGKEASSDGSVLLGHNEELGDRTCMHIYVVPSMPYSPDDVIETFYGAKIRVSDIPHWRNISYTYIKIAAFNEKYVPGDFAAGMNERQVAIANNLAYSKETWLRKTKGWRIAKTGELLWSEFMEIALKWASTAKEAVEIIGWLAETYGLGCDPGTMFGIVDPNEGWWIEIGYKHWVAKRVPSNAMEMRANYFRIGTEWDMGSADVIEFAIEQGWYNPESGPFNWTEVYGDLSGWGSWQYLRHWRVESLLNEYSENGITVSEVMSILRDHYEETPYDTTNMYEYGSPHFTPYRTICRAYTVMSFVSQSRSWMPSVVGGVMWIALTSPCSSVYVPWYIGILSVPPEYQMGTNGYDKNSAWWTFERLSDAVDKNYGSRIRFVRNIWRSFEEREFEEVRSLETDVIRLLSDGYYDYARTLLTSYTWYRALLAMQLAAKLTAQIKYLKSKR